MPEGRPPSRPPIWDLRPLQRPLWWAALALLLFNDNVLKGSGLAPGWLTGKLSDFAFLLVAPVLLAALLPRALPWRRPIALAVVALVYGAADLSPAVSQAIVAAAHRVGLPWKLWPDVSDLMALAVLPLTWRLTRPAPPPATGIATVNRSRPLLESAGVFAGALACLATSAPYVYARAPFVVNQTHQSRAITATWLLRPVPCDGDLTAFAAGLTARDLGDPYGATLPIGEVAVLGKPPAPGQPLDRTCPSKEGHEYGTDGYGDSSTTCVGVLVQASSELAVLAVYPPVWTESQDDFITCFHDDPESQCQAHFSQHEDPGPDSLALRERDGKLVFSVGTGSRLRIGLLSPAPPIPDAGAPGHRADGADTAGEAGADVDSGL